MSRTTRIGARQLVVIGLLIAAAAATAPSPARSEVRLSNEAVGANYRVSVMSWWQIPFRTVVRQQQDFSCGSAALATLLTYHYGRPTTETASFSSMWESGDQAVIRRVGFSLFEMKTYLQSLGYRAEGYRMTPAQLVGAKRPLIVLLDLKGYKHFVVVKGVRGRRVLVGDPMTGLTQYSLADFVKIWNGIGLAIVPKDGVAADGDFRPAYNLVGDWGPWSRAPMEGGALHVALGDLTNDLPPIYQITDRILIDVRVGTVR